MKKYIVEWPNEPDKAFFGELLAEVSNEKYSKSGFYKIYRVFLTANGNYVFHVLEKSKNPKHYTKSRGMVEKGLDGIIDYFGHGRLAKELYSEMGIKDVETIE